MIKQFIQKKKTPSDKSRQSTQPMYTRPRKLHKINPIQSRLSLVCSSKSSMVNCVDCRCRTFCYFQLYFVIFFFNIPSWSERPFKMLQYFACLFFIKRCLNLIPLWERMWHNCVFHVRQCCNGMCCFQFRAKYANWNDTGATLAALRVFWRRIMTSCPFSEWDTF